MSRKFCPYDLAYLLDHPKLLGWKKCPGCGYCEDLEGYSLINPKPKEDFNDDVEILLTAIEYLKNSM